MFNSSDYKSTKRRFSLYNYVLFVAVYISFFSCKTQQPEKEEIEDANSFPTVEEVHKKYSDKESERAIGKIYFGMNRTEVELMFNELSKNLEGYIGEMPIEGYRDYYISNKLVDIRIYGKTEKFQSNLKIPEQLMKVANNLVQLYSEKYGKPSSYHKLESYIVDLPDSLAKAIPRHMNAPWEKIIAGWRLNNNVTINLYSGVGLLSADELTTLPNGQFNTKFRKLEIQYTIVDSLSIETRELRRLINTYTEGKRASKQLIDKI